MIREYSQLIAGPCAAETKIQVLNSANAMKERGIDMVRASLWKPRTIPGFEGVGSIGIPWLAEATKSGITVGTEVLVPEHVTELINGITKSGGEPANIFVWLGSRNQNHLVQRAISKRILDETPNTVRLLIKNQLWSDERHWLGIVDHVLGAGIDAARLILCHRGFSPNGNLNPNNFRNLPDFDMAMRVKEKTGLPMLLDPSHIGGSVENVFRTTNLAADYEFDGLMIEVHPTPRFALTDAQQQLTFEDLDRLITQFKI